MSSPCLQLFRSELKLNILKSLLCGEKKLSALREELGSSSSTIIHALTDLESLKLTQQTGKNYRLTSLGVIEAYIIEEVTSAATVLEKYQDFWLGHDITAIPNHLLQRIGALENSTLVQNDSVELDRVHSTFQQILLTSKRVRGTSPIFHSDFVGVFQRMLSEGATVELILTAGVLNRTMSLADMEQFLGYIEKDRLRVFLAEELGVALTVTENSFSMGLFINNGEYDYTKDLISNSQVAISWGEKLFQHYIEKAKRLELKDLGHSL